MRSRLSPGGNRTVIAGAGDQSPMRNISGLRWWIAILLGVLLALNYIDRQSFPVAVLEISKHISISDREYGRLQAIFLITYSLMYAGGGKLLDVLGTRLGYALMILWWSAATVGQGLVQGIFGIEIARAMLGLGEGGGFPGAAKAVSEWFAAGAVFRFRDLYRRFQYRRHRRRTAGDRHHPAPQLAMGLLHHRWARLRLAGRMVAPL